MKMFVLAGGFGSRLAAKVKDVPKPLAPINGKPFLQLQIDQWIAQGICEFTFLLHHRADEVINFLRLFHVNCSEDCKIDWVIEPTPMDTGGAISYALQELEVNDNFLVMNADTWLGGGVENILTSVPPALAVIRNSNSSRYGQVQTDQNNIVTAFKEKNEELGFGWINAGLCFLSPDLFDCWDGKPFSLERELFPILAKNGILKAVPLDVNFIDIGVPEDYDKFCLWEKYGQNTIL